MTKLNAATNEFVQSAAGKEMFLKLGVVGAGGTPQDLKAFTDAEIAKWEPIIKAAEIKF